MAHGGRKWALRALVLAVLTAFVGACGGGGGGDNPPPAGKVTVSGQVTGSGALQGVEVSAGGVTDTTDANGLYSLTEVPVPASGRLVVTYKKAGYGTYQRSLPVEAGKSYAVAAVLAQYNVSELANVDPTVVQTLEGVDPATSQVKVRIEMPAGSLQSGGAAVTGPITVNMVYGDPSTAGGRAVFPGDYMAAPAVGAEPTTELESVAFAEVKLTTATGAEIQNVAFSEPATLTLRLPDEFQTGGAKAGTYVAGDAVKGFIEWWSYDETTGAWLEEDADANPTNGVTKAEVIDDAGVLYARGKVTHFSWWNADRPVNEHACLCATVEDQNSVPLPGVEIVADGVSYNGTSYPALTGADGKACVNVKRSSSAASPETVKIKARAGNLDFVYDVTDAAEGDAATDAVAVWTTQGSTRDGTGVCYDLQQPIRIAYDGRVTGTVTFEHSSLPAANFTIRTSFGPTATTDSAGAYELRVPLNQDVLLFAPGLQSQLARVTSADVPVVVNFVLPNRIPTITSLTRSPNTTPVAVGAAVTFTAAASDPDGDPITYAWTADAGSPTTGTGRTFAWTAPATSTTATVTVTVRDDKGAVASQSLPVVVGGSTGGTTLKLTVRDNLTSGQPVAGVYVILHGAGGSVERTIQTGANGIADFGDIGRTRATLTVAHERVNAGFTDREISTFVEALAGDVVYYLNTGGDFDPFSCQTSDTIIQVPTTGYPATADFAQLQPVFSFNFVNDTFTDVPVCPGAIQTDQKLSLLATAVEFDPVNFTQNLVKYGFLLDQTVTNGASYTVAFDRDPVLVGWSVTGGTANAVQVNATRKGVDFELAQFFQEPGQGGGAVSSGTLFVPTAFPADAFQVEAERFDFQNPDATAVGSSKKYSTLPTTVTVPMPDYSFTTFARDAGTGTFTWTLTGASPKDVLILSYSQFGQNIGTSWEAIMAPSATSWTPVTLPAPVASWVDPAQGTELSVAVADFDIAAGFDAIWTYVIQGNDPEGGSNQMLFGTRYLSSGTPVLTRSAGRAAAGAASAEPGRDPLKGLRGLLRR
jgi:hypothetical protein